jgi:hypothetical protein
MRERLDSLSHDASSRSDLSQSHKCCVRRKLPDDSKLIVAIGVRAISKFARLFESIVQFFSWLNVVDPH